MDPNANLREQLLLARVVLNDVDNDRTISADDAGRLADLVLSLNCWIANGGFMPEDWQR